MTGVEVLVGTVAAENLAPDSLLASHRTGSSQRLLCGLVGSSLGLPLTCSLSSPSRAVRRLSLSFTPTELIPSSPSSQDCTIWEDWNEVSVSYLTSPYP